MLPSVGQNLQSDSDFPPKMEPIFQPHEPPWFRQRRVWPHSVGGKALLHWVWFDIRLVKPHFDNFPSWYRQNVSCCQPHRSLAKCFDTIGAESPAETGYFHCPPSIVRRPGIEPGSQEWESCMIPLHQRRLIELQTNILELAMIDLKRSEFGPVFRAFWSIFQMRATEKLVSDRSTWLIFRIGDSSFLVPYISQLLIQTPI